MSKPIDYAALTERRCSGCKLVLPVTRFNKYTDETAPLTGWRYYSHCRACNAKSCQAYGANNKPKRNARLKVWRRNNPALAAALDRRKKLRQYGLTEADVSEMRRRQKGRCRLCEKVKPLVIDHCHTSGRVRGLLCTKCNNGLGWIEGHADLIERIPLYIAQQEAAAQ